jgi:hypothetical protein
MFNKINFKNLVKRGNVSTKILDTDYIGLMKHNAKSNGEFEQSVISAKDLKADIAEDIVHTVLPVPLTTVVDVSSAQILTGGDWTLLPTLTGDDYYSSIVCILEFTSSDGYVVPVLPKLNWGGSMITEVDELINKNVDTVAVVNVVNLMGTGDMTGVPKNSYFAFNLDLGTPPTSGTGTLKIKTTYTIGTFG